VAIWKRWFKKTKDENPDNVKVEQNKTPDQLSEDPQPAIETIAIAQIALNSTFPEIFGEWLSLYAEGLCRIVCKEFELEDSEVLGITAYLETINRNTFDGSLESMVREGSSPNEAIYEHVLAIVDLCEEGADTSVIAKVLQDHLTSVYFLEYVINCVIDNESAPILVEEDDEEE